MWVLQHLPCQPSAVPGAPEAMNKDWPRVSLGDACEDLEGPQSQRASGQWPSVPGTQRGGPERSGGGAGTVSEWGGLAGSFPRGRGQRGHVTAAGTGWQPAWPRFPPSCSLIFDGAPSSPSSRQREAQSQDGEDTGALTNAGSVVCSPFIPTATAAPGEPHQDVKEETGSKS